MSTGVSGPARHKRPGGVLVKAARNRRGSVGLLLAGAVVLLAILGPLFASHGPTDLVTAPFAKPSGTVPLGADVLGRDVLSRVLSGGRTILIMAVCATLIGVVLGSAAGVTAGYVQGRVDGLIMRAVDVILAFPQLVFALLLVSVVGPKLWLIVLAVGISHAPQVARVMRAATLEVSERDFVKALEIDGVRTTRVMSQEILPNLVSPLMVESGLRLTFSIIGMTALTFLGFGQQPPSASWGLMINENRVGLVANPWGVIAPAVLIALLTVGVNMYTDAVARVTIGVDRFPEEAVIAIQPAEAAA